MKDLKQEFLKYIGPDIIDVGQVPVIKEAILYSLFADKLHVLIVGHPSAGSKSSYKESLELITPKFIFYPMVEGATTSAGIRNSLLGLRNSPISGVIFLDEIHRARKHHLAFLYSLLQFQEIAIRMADWNETFKANVNAIATANPRGDFWKEYGNIPLMKQQLPLPLSLLRRFHITVCTRDYSLKEFDKINREYRNAKNELEKLKEKADYIKGKIIELREINPKIEVPEKVYNFLLNLKKFSDDLLFPITPEINEGLIQTAIARARIAQSNKIKEEHWDDVIKFYFKVIGTTGLNAKLIESKFKANLTKK